MTKVKSNLSQMICTECGNVFPIQRMLRKQKEKGHLKKLYCIKCKKEVNHKEIRYWDKNINNESEI